MRFFLFITLILSMAVSPAVAVGYCASMGSVSGMMDMTHGDGPAPMKGMIANDCDSMGEETSQEHDAGCLAACALACPGFYSGADPSAVFVLAFHSVQYAIPSAEPGLAAPSHLDPPPPRS